MPQHAVVTLGRFLLVGWWIKYITTIFSLWNYYPAMYILGLIKGIMLRIILGILMVVNYNFDQILENLPSTHK